MKCDKCRGNVRSEATVMSEVHRQQTIRKVATIYYCDACMECWLSRLPNLRMPFTPVEEAIQ